MGDGILVDPSEYLFCEEEESDKSRLEGDESSRCSNANNKRKFSKAK